MRSQLEKRYVPSTKRFDRAFTVGPNRRVCAVAYGLACGVSDATFANARADIKKDSPWSKVRRKRRTRRRSSARAVRHHHHHHQHHQPAPAPAPAPPPPPPPLAHSPAHLHTHLWGLPHLIQYPAPTEHPHVPQTIAAYIRDVRSSMQSNPAPRGGRTKEWKTAYDKVPHPAGIFSQVIPVISSDTK